MLSDKHVTNPEDRVKVGQTLHCRILKIDTDRFNVDLTSRSSDLMDKDLQWKPAHDDYYDADLEAAQIQQEEEKKKQQARQTYVKRVIAHPSFHNIAYKDCEKLMADMEQGDVIIRPSSKGSDHLTVTWKVTDEVLQHIDVKEEGKENAFSLGTSLWIHKEEFEDLDEIIARHIQPMAAFARDLIYFKYYKDSDGGKREITDKVLIEEKKKAPSRIPYVFSVSKQFPGKFLLGYLPRNKPRYEYVTVTPDGLRYRSQNFHSLGSVIRWFKEHFRDPVPGTPARTPMVGRTPGAPTPNPRTPMVGIARTPAAARTPMTSGRTPQVGGINLQTVDPATIQRAAAGLSSNIFNTLSQVAGATPQQFGNASNFSGGYGSGFNYRPATTPMMTPLMTPSYHNQNIQGTPVQHNMAAATPSYQPTPRGGGWPGATPHTPAAQTPRAHQSSHTSTAGTDWAKAAAQWAKHRARKPATPRSGQSPRTAPTGSPGDSPRGDSTPLIDER